jgi:hypothetical protein
MTITLEDVVRLATEVNEQEKTIADWMDIIGVDVDTLAEMFSNWRQFIDAEILQDALMAISGREFDGPESILFMNYTRALFLGWQIRDQYGKQKEQA